MKFAVKKPKIVCAWCLGEGSDMEKLLVQEGVICAHSEDNTFELFSRESVNGTGQIAKAGDYFKVDTVDGKHFPYPNEREYFQARHRHVSGERYELVTRPVGVWLCGDPLSEEVRFLLDSGKLTIDSQNDTRYFNTFLFGAPLSAAKDAALVFYRVDRDDSGRITAIDFNFVENTCFQQNYMWLD